jgi:Bacterial Ig domain
VKTALYNFVLLGSLTIFTACLGTGNSNPNSTPDTIKPTVRLGGSVTEVRFSGPVTLTAFATDDRGIEKVEFFEGSNRLGVVSNAPYTWKVDLKAAQSGKKSYSAVATDTSNNSKESDSLVVNVAITRGFALLGSSFLDAHTNQIAGEPCLVTDSGGHPVVAWDESDGTSNNVYVKRWTGTTWESVGNGLDVNTNKDASQPSMVLDSNSNPVVVWTESDGTSNNIYVKRWTGTAWILVGSGFLDVNTNQFARLPSLALDSSGNPVVAWTERDGTFTNIYLKRWTGTAWILVGNGLLNLINNQSFSDASLALDSSGNPVVAWSENDGTSINVYVKRWNGTAWVFVGNGFLDVSTNTTAYQPSLVLDSSGNPVVSWSEFDGASFNIYIKRWNGTNWFAVGNGFLDVNTNRYATDPSLVLDSSGNPVVAWQEFDGNFYNIYVKRWSGTTWAAVGNGPLDVNVNQYSEHPSLGLDSSGNPMVAWRESDGASENIYVKRFND